MYTIYVDIDGVLADLATKWIQIYNEIYDDDIRVEQWTTWDIHKLVKPACGEQIYEILKAPWLYDVVSPYLGALEMVQRLRKVARVVYATASPAGTFGVKWKWLERNGFEPKEKDYIEINDKTLLSMWGTAIIEDNLALVRKWKGYPILIDRPWNQGDTGMALRLQSYVIVSKTLEEWAKCAR